MKVTFVTGNKNKVRETEKILGIPLNIKDIDLDEIQELDVQRVTLHKLYQAYNTVKGPVIVDDAGVYIDAWNGFPGPLIKWLIQAGEKSPELLLKMMENEKNRAVTVRLIIGFHDGKKAHTFEGKISGKISKSLRGTNGFDWDKVYIPDGHTRTFAEMTPEEKNTVSHRRKALDKFKKFLIKHKYIV